MGSSKRGDAAQLDPVAEPSASGGRRLFRAWGRPVGVSVDPRGALIVADDLANVIWRIVPSQHAPAIRAPARPAVPPAREDVRRNWAPY